MRRLITVERQQIDDACARGRSPLDWLRSINTSPFDIGLVRPSGDTARHAPVLSSQASALLLLCFGIGSDVAMLLTGPLSSRYIAIA
jgi:hypothetical protein